MNDLPFSSHTLYRVSFRGGARGAFRPPLGIPTLLIISTLVQKKAMAHARYIFVAGFISGYFV